MIKKLVRIGKKIEKKGGQSLALVVKVCVVCGVGEPHYVVPIVCVFVRLLFYRSICLSVTYSIGWSVGRSVGQSIGQNAAILFGAKLSINITRPVVRGTADADRLPEASPS